MAGAAGDAGDELIDRVVARGREQSDRAAEGSGRTHGDRDDDPDRVEAFLRQYYGTAGRDELDGRAPEDLAAAALAHLGRAAVRPAGTAIVEVEPATAADGTTRPDRLVLDVVTDDMPFVVDSVTTELARRGWSLQLVVHPIVDVVRDATGRRVGLGDAGGQPESFLHVELSPREPVDRDELVTAVERILDDVRRSVGDWSTMRAQAELVADDLERERLPVDAAERSEAVELLRWMAAERFTFIGYREYELVTAGEPAAVALRPVAGSGLGLLRTRSEDPAATAVKVLSPAVGALARQPTLLVLTKTSALSTIHRPARLDYVGVKRFDDYGRVIGERRFLGLYTAAAYNASAFEVPVLRRKAVDVVARAGFPRTGHSTRRLVDIIESYPRDELFQIATDELFDVALGILRLQDRPRVRLFRRVDPYGRFASCLVYVPRDRYTTAVREQMRDILQRAHQGTSVEYTARITESPLAVLHFVVLTPGRTVPSVDTGALEAELAGAARSWTDDLREALLESAGEAQGAARFARFGAGFPAAYRDEWSVTEAAADVARLDALADDDLSMALYPDDHGTSGWGLKLFRSGTGLALSDVLPILERAGMTVVDERPYVVTSSDGVERWIYDFTLALTERGARTVESRPQSVLDGLAAVWSGRADNDGLNRLMTEAALQWREVALLRTYRKYLRQTGTAFSQSYIERCLAARPELVRLLLALFDARFNPDRPLDASESRQADVDALALQVEAALELVDSLDEDRILRGFFRLVQATMRTNFFQRDEQGEPRAAVAVKLDPRSLPDLPAPRPHHEIFLHAPRVEGVHLRGGDVARGGLRWSDRPEDFRTEILGLMKAQLVKNSVIVPVGAKGGFVVRRPPETGGRDALQQEAVACYRELVSGLLDLTDNLVDGRAVHPPRTLCYDGDDTYLVVAADKGTATFSDIANELAVARGFWLGDAFASGGSTGYDHKRMGITARGAWESVKRHFGELGLDVRAAPVTVVGIGDMSGDVFGNGMLLSEHLKLVAAFDHRHVFLDPTPDPSTSYAERRRLFELPRSSWDDYDRTLISVGGGVFPRTAKSIRLSPEVQDVLGVRVDALVPPDLVRAVLRAPVDLLWNGGIGTYVKATAEANGDVGDKANDVVRVDGADLRCRVVGEGGNLGFTQRGRVEYALAGGRIYTDSIDNSAGVDCSDHEVNIKILVDSVVRDGVIDLAERNRVLVEMTDDVALHVLRDNEANTEALAIAGRQAPSLAEVHARYLESLEQDGVLDRALEFLPTTKEIEQRRANGAGLTAPELAILLAYTKVDLDRVLLASQLPDDPFVAPRLFDYFPAAIRDRFRDQIERHPLRREILATRISNEVVNRGGTSFLYRLADESQLSLDAIAAAHLASSAIFDITTLWPRIGSLDGEVDPMVQVAMLLRARRLAERGTRWLLRTADGPLDLSATVERLAPGVSQVRSRLEEFVVGDDFDRIRASTVELRDAGIPADVAGDVAKLDALVAAPDLVELAAATGAELARVASVYFTLGERLHFGWLRDQIEALPRDDRWRTLARTSLLGDLLARQRSIVGSVLATVDAIAGADPGELDQLGDPNAAIDAWVAAHPGPVDRYLQLVGDIGTSEKPDLAVLSVTLRVVQTLVDAGPPAPRPHPAA